MIHKNQKLFKRITLKIAQKNRYVNKLLMSDEEIEALKELIKNGRIYHNIYFFELHSLSSIEIFKPTLEHMTSLRIFRTSIEDCQLIELCNLMPLLKTVEIAGAITETRGTLVFPEFKHLNRLKISSFNALNLSIFQNITGLKSYVSNKGFKSFLFNNHNLKLLSITETDGYFKNFLPFFTAKVQDNIKFQLKAMVLTSVLPYEKIVDCDNIPKFFEKQSEMTRLTLNVDELDSKVVNFLQNKNLKHLRIRIDGQGNELDGAPFQVKSTELITLRFCCSSSKYWTAERVNAFVQLFKKLKHLELTFTTSFDGIIAFPEFMNPPDVRVSMERRMKNLIDIRIGPALRVLSFKSSTPTSISDWSRLFDMNQNITHLRIDGFVNNELISIIIEKLKKLQHLWIKYHGNATCDEQTVEIFANSHLETVSLQNAAKYFADKIIKHFNHDGGEYSYDIVRGMKMISMIYPTEFPKFEIYYPFDPENMYLIKAL